MSVLSTVYWENPIWRWLLAIGVIVLVYFVSRILMRVLIRRLRRYAATTATRFDDLVADLLSKTKLLFVIILALFSGSLIVALPDIADRIFRITFVLALLLQAGYWGSAFVTFWINRYVDRRLEEDPAAATSMAALAFIAKLVVWCVVGLLALENLGIDVTTLIAGLGIGGIAVALAVQNILGDLFASLSIIIDKPFVIGDFIIVGEQMGSVERIGLKTTRVRSLSGEQIIFSNGDLLGSRVRNYKRMYERRIVFGLGVTYDTPPDVLETLPGTVRDIIEAQDHTRFDRCHFKSFGSYALELETVYYMLIPDYTAYMDTQQAINLSILRAFAEAGVEFAYPTQTLFVDGLPSSVNE